MTKIAILIILALSIYANDFTQFTIKQQNKIKNILIKKVDNTYLTSQKYIFSNNTHIVIRFNTIVPNEIDDFETQYGLTLKEILITGDYIYSHNRSDILDLIQLIINNDNIKKIKPMWSKSIKLR